MQAVKKTTLDNGVRVVDTASVNYKLVFNKSLSEHEYDFNILSENKIHPEDIRIAVEGAIFKINDYSCNYKYTLRLKKHRVKIIVYLRINGAIIKHKIIYHDFK